MFKGVMGSLLSIFGTAYSVYQGTLKTQLQWTVGMGIFSPKYTFNSNTTCPFEMQKNLSRIPLLISGAS